MEVFVKSPATFRTVKMATAVSRSLVVDSLDSEASTVTVKGTEINRSDTGSWLIADGTVYRISNVKPEKGTTVLTLAPPLDSFARPLELESQPSGQTVGGFLSAQLRRHWAAETDAEYAMPYLQVSDSDTSAFVPPETDGSGCFVLSDYARLMRKSYRVLMEFAAVGDILQCRIRKVPAASRQIAFGDGRSTLQSVAYSSSGLAKLTVLHDVETGEKDADGNKIYSRERSVWYLSESGEISQLIPARRASGEWGTLHIQGAKDVQAEVVKAFAKNKSNHKLEFWSTLDIPVQTDCIFPVYGELLRSYISYKRKSSDDKRYYYKSGELATTATEKLRGAMK